VKKFQQEKKEKMDGPINWANEQRYPMGQYTET
jgi:hypothetical protein